MEPSDSLFNEILSGGPSQGTLFLVLTKMREQGLLERVITECEKALVNYPFDLRIRKLRAEACLEAGRLEEAESEIRTVIEKINELTTSYRLLADLCIDQGKSAEAIEALKLYLIHCPDDKESYILLESMTPKKEVLQEMAQAQEELPSIYIGEEMGALAQPVGTALPDIATPTLAEIYYSQGKTGEAIETYEKIVERNPDEFMSRARLDELRSIVEQARAMEMKQKAIVARKKKITSILEIWLAGIREQVKAGGL
jgi:tetratricopeptide (TPR) repeat protein